MAEANRIRIGDFMHIGVIVNSIEETLERMEGLFELDECKTIAFPPAGTPADELQMMYLGKKSSFSARFCFLKVASTEIELIEPVAGESVWFDFLHDHGEGVHHLKYEVESINDTLRFFNDLGIRCLQYGSAVGANKGKIFAYFDTVPQLGYVIEVLNRRIGETVDPVLCLIE